MSDERLSNTRIDKLGDRLRQRNVADDDLRLLDAYRRSFGKAYETVVGAVREKLSLEPTGRPAKSTTAIIDKLRRESIRLSQIQDIAGCRLVISDIVEQERVVHALKALFANTDTVDRRDKPSHGYRAVHVVVSVDRKVVEVQVRTALQHQWAELSEKLSDLLDPSIKYGGGDQFVKALLAKTSAIVSEAENNLAQVVRLTESVTSLPSPPESLKAKLAQSRNRHEQMQKQISDLLTEALTSLEQVRRSK